MWKYICDMCDITSSAADKKQKSGCCVSYRVPRSYLLLLVAACSVGFCSASKLPFAAPGGLSILDSLTNDHRLDVAKLKWLSSLQDSAYPKTASDIIADDFSSIYPSSPSSRMELVDDPWAPQPLALDNLYTLGPYRSSNRVKQLETLVSKLADNYSPETADGVNDGYYPSYIWPEPGKSSSSRGMTDLEKANTEHPTYVTSDPFKRAESHYKERLARLT